LKIVKHCQDALPQMVTGSLLGLMVENGVLEVTHAFPFPESSSGKDKSASSDGLILADDDASTNALTSSASAPLEGYEFQLEMMRMLREVNVDNNCVGWYQAMYLGSYSNSNLLEHQWSYQTDLSPNAVVLLYDPIQTTNGQLVLKCLRLTETCLQHKANQLNTYLDPRDIFEEVPIKLTNPGLVRALLADIRDAKLWVVQGDTTDAVAATTTTTTTNAAVSSGGATAVGMDVMAALPWSSPSDITLDRLDLSTNPYLEKHLEFLCHWVDDLAAEQQKFQSYTRTIQRGNKNDPHWKQRRGATKAGGDDGGWSASEAPKRLESLLMTHQIRTYCDQMDQFAGGGFGKLFLAGGLHGKDTTATTSKIISSNTSSSNQVVN
jgi:translation initiation factor 3 subunit H